MPWPPARPAAMTPEAFLALLAAAGLTQREAAARLGVSHVSVYRWATGATPIAAARAALIRDRLNPR